GVEARRLRSRDLGQRARAAHGERRARALGLERRDPEALEARGQDDAARFRVRARELRVVESAEEAHALGDAELGGEAREPLVLAVLRLAGEQELGQVGIERQRAHEELEVLAALDVADVQERRARTRGARE